MKKLVLALMLICAVFATGCGADNAAKDAQQKVDKAADEAKQKVDQAADAADKKIEDVSNDAQKAMDKAADAANEADKKIESLSNDAQQTMDKVAADATNIKNEAVQRIQNVKQKMAQLAADTNITEIDSSRLAIGGVLIDSTKDSVRRIYGEPNDIKSATIPEGTIDTWYYGDSFEIQFLNDKVYSIASTKANGLATPDGITVGASKSALTEKYGDSAGSDVIFYTTPNHATSIGFGVDNDKVSSIEVYAQ